MGRLTWLDLGEWCVGFWLSGEVTLKGPGYRDALRVDLGGRLGEVMVQAEWLDYSGALNVEPKIWDIVERKD